MLCKHPVVMTMYVAQSNDETEYVRWCIHCGAVKTSGMVEWNLPELQRDIEAGVNTTL